MRIRRGLLFWGLFLVAFGAVPLLVRAGAVDAATIAGAWRLWPVILIAIGIGLVVGRSQVAIIGTVVTAVVLGTAAGGALASGGGWFGLIGDCATGRQTASQSDDTGAFVSPATLLLELNCGTIQLATQSGSDWALHAGFSGPPPIVSGGADRLDITSPDGGDSRRQEWTLRVPTDLLGAIDLQANAGTGTFLLGGARLSRLTGQINAFDLAVDAAEARIERIDLEMNAGRARISLGSGPVTGKLSVNAGAIDLCVPSGSQLRIHVVDQIALTHNLDARGLTRNGGTWTRSAGDLNSVIDLTVDGAAASFTLDPQGGCR